jgi:hypothetical protein
MMRRTPQRLLGGLAATAMLSAALVAGTSASSEADDRPVLKVPFPCQQTWRGATYAGHSPANAIDLNWGGGDDDLGKPVKASASGQVVAAGVGEGGYGNRVIIGHGNHWSTLYAHLSSISVSVGQHVEDTTTIGRVGKSGGQDTSHLHYEQRHYGDDVKIRFGTSTWVAYPSTAYYTRTRC